MNDGIGFRLFLLTSSEGSAACQSEEDEQGNNRANDGWNNMKSANHRPPWSQQFRA